MAINRKLYPAEWEEMRQARMEAVGYSCEQCGIEDCTVLVNPRKPHPLYPDGAPYVVRLQLCHKRQYQTWNREAETMVLCPSCHRKFDRQFRRRGSAKLAQPVGLVLLWVQHRGQRVLAAEASSFDDLLEVIASFSMGVEFEVQPEVLMQVAGVGRYQKVSDSVVTLREEGVCQSFGQFLQQVLIGVVS